MVPRPSASLLVALLVGGCARLAAVDVDVDAAIGPKFLRHNDWHPVNTQAELGIEVAVRPDGWPVALAVNALGSDAVDRTRHTAQGTLYREGATSELQLGVAAFCHLPGNARPFVAGGLALVWAGYRTDDDATSTSTSGGGVGWWAAGGVLWTIGEHFNIGPQLGYSSARVKLDFGTVEAGGARAGVVLGAHW